MLDQGDSGGRSLFVVTDWMAKRMYDLGYLQEINHDDLPTVFENILPQFEKSTTDPERKFSIPWQGGQTGIFVDTTKAPEIDAVSDLFDPKYKGKVTMLTEMRDTVPLVLQSEGINPDDATKEDWLAAIDKLQEARDSGQIRHFTGQRVHRGPDRRQHRRRDRLVRRHLADRQGGRRVAQAERRLRPVLRPGGDPGRCAEHAGGARVPELRVHARERGEDHGLRAVRHAGRRASRRSWPSSDPELANDPKIFPTEEEIADCSEDPNPPGSPEDVAEVEAAFQEVISG